MIRCYITDRHTLSGETLLESIARNLQDGVTLDSTPREDLSSRDLYDLVLAAKSSAQSFTTPSSS